MGLFSSKTRVTVATQASRVIEDTKLPDAVRTGVLKSIFNGGDIPEYTMEELVASVGVRAERMYEYARQHYVHGLPSSQVLTATAARDEVQTTLQTLEGAAVDLVYCHVGPPNNLHIGWMQLVSDYGYDPATNQLATLTAQKGTPVYLNDMQIVVPASQLDQYEPGALDQWGPVPAGGYTPWKQRTSTLSNLLQHKPVVSSTEATEDYVLAWPVWANGQDGGATEALMLLIEGYDAQADYFHVRYTVGGVTKFWMYRAGAGTYPSLDAVFYSEASTMGSFFPFAYFRYNKVSEISDKTTQAYLTSRKLVKYLGMDYDMVAEAIDENPDIADVEQAMLVMAVPANTTNPMEQRYLYDFFDGLHGASGLGLSSANQAGLQATYSGIPDLARNTVVIKDSRFKMALSNHAIYKRRVAGSIGIVGSSTSAMGTVNLTVTNWVVQGDNEAQPIEQVMPVKTHIYRRQINHYQYDEIEVVALKMLYHVYGKYTVTADETDDILLVPLDHSITEDYSMADREELYARSLHYVFNSVVFTKISWYQSGFFQFVMIVIAAVITFYSMGADGGSSLGAALAAGAYTTAAMIVLESIVIGMLFQAAFKLFVKAVGLELAFLLAIVAAAYGAYDVISAGSVKGAPWAQELLQLSSGLAKGIQAEVSSMTQNLLEEATVFGKLVEDQTKTLETAQELLEGNNKLSPFVIFGESPDDFYNRTVHSGNVGAMGISAISSYVDIALTLPKINDTLGELT